MSEVSQLHEMSAGMSAAREGQARLRRECGETGQKISGLEKQLEEQVSAADNRREQKAAATSALQKMVQKFRDLDVKVDHVAKLNDTGHTPRLARATAGVQALQEGLAAEVEGDLRSSLERLSLDNSRKDTALEREDRLETLPTEIRAKEDEVKELISRVDELNGGYEAIQQEQGAKEAARKSSLQVGEHIRAERPAVAERIGTAESAHRQTIALAMEIQAGLERAETAEQGQAALENSRLDSQTTDIHTLEQSRAQLSIDRALEVRIEELDKEAMALAETDHALSVEAEAVLHESSQEHPNVLELRSRLQKDRQRTDMIHEQEAVKVAALAGHAIYQPETANTKAEYQNLTSRIDAIESNKASIAARKAAHEEEDRRLRRETANVSAAAVEVIASEEKEHVRLAAERKEMATAGTSLGAAVANKRAEKASVEAERQEFSAELERLLGLEEKESSSLSEEDPECDRLVAEDRAVALGLLEEDDSNARAAEDIRKELEKKEAAETDRRQRATEAAKRELFTAAVAERTQEEKSRIFTARDEEVNRLEEQITADDNKYRKAFAEESQSASAAGGLERRLREELEGSEAQYAAEASQVTALESSVKRLESENGQS